MARVYEAVHLRLGSRVALKRMNPELLAQPLASARFVREASVAARIRHPNVVRVFDIGSNDGIPFIVMDLVEGTDLAAVLRERGPLPLARIVEIVLPVLDALRSAHDEGIIHRDLKPANLMLTRSAHRGIHPMLLDFGISKIVDDHPTEAALTASRALLGTLQYMAPELTRGASFATPASDQYAIGVILYECATGQRPFFGENSYDLMHAIVTHSVIPPSRIRRELPPEFDALVQRTMSRDPDARFPSVLALGNALMSFADRRAWLLWENKFLGTDADAWAAGSTSVTSLDCFEAESAVASSVRPAHAVSLRTGILVACTFIATLVLAITFALADDRRHEAAPPAPKARVAADPTTRLGALSSALVAPAILSPVVSSSEPAVSPAGEARVQHLRGRGGRVNPAARSASANLRVRAAETRSEQKQEHEQRDVGSNGAPILE